MDIATRTLLCGRYHENSIRWSLPLELYYVLYYTTSVSGAFKEGDGGRYHKNSIIFFYYTNSVSGTTCPHGN